MNAVRIRTRVDSETLHLPELREMIGKDVEIIVLEDKPAPKDRPQDLSALEVIAGSIDLDFDAIQQLREISKL
ncbi:MAG TPA: hypothetical protein VGI81_15780 [Tepidisphaeraceae bacterium]|jgi:hypothetical protein